MDKEYILITGASSGIGEYLATQFSQKYNVILCSRNIKKLNNVRKNCNDVNSHLIWNFDLNNTNDLEKGLSEFIKENNITVSYFIHCAGLMKMLPCKMFSVEAFESLYNVNVISAAIITKVLTSKKYNSSSVKSILYISSNISNFGAKAFSVYASSKSALDGLMHCLAVELAPKVRVNSILPGGIKTQMTESMKMMDEETEERMYKEYPLGIGKPEYIYDAAEFLISEKAKWITGQQFVVDGGRTINITG